MGKVTGFLEYERHDRKYLPVAERLKNYKEFVLPLPEKELRDQAARCMDCGVPYCHGSVTATGAPTGCPVNNQIPDWNDLTYRGHWDEAARNLHSTNNFPEVTGRVCPAPCEASCTLNIDENPVTIKSIECEIADRAIAQGLKPEAATVKTGKKVAIVGSGPRALPARSNSRAPATRCMSMNAGPRPAVCCATASPTSRWRRSTSTAASSRCRAKACSSITAPMSASMSRSTNW